MNENNKRWFAILIEKGKGMEIKEFIINNTKDTSLEDYFFTIKIRLYPSFDYTDDYIIIEMILNDKTYEFILNTPGVKSFVSKKIICRFPPVAISKKSIEYELKVSITNDYSSFCYGDYVSINEETYKHNLGYVYSIDYEKNIAKIALYNIRSWFDKFVDIPLNNISHRMVEIWHFDNISHRMSEILPLHDANNTIKAKKRKNKIEVSNSRWFILETSTDCRKVKKEIIRRSKNDNLHKYFLNLKIINKILFIEMILNDYTYKYILQIPGVKSFVRRNKRTYCLPYPLSAKDIYRAFGIIVNDDHLNSSFCQGDLVTIKNSPYFDDIGMIKSIDEEYNIVTVILYNEYYLFNKIVKVPIRYIERFYCAVYNLFI